MDIFAMQQPPYKELGLTDKDLEVTRRGGRGGREGGRGERCACARSGGGGGAMGQMRSAFFMTAHL